MLLLASPWLCSLTIKMLPTSEVSLLSGGAMRSGSQDVPNCQRVAGGASLCARLHASAEVSQIGSERLSPCPAAQLPAACYELFEQPGSCYRGVCVLPWLGVQISPGVHPVCVTSPEKVTSKPWVLGAGTPACNVLWHIFSFCCMQAWAAPHHRRFSAASLQLGTACHCSSAC